MTDHADIAELKRQVVELTRRQLEDEKKIATLETKVRDHEGLWRRGKWTFYAFAGAATGLTVVLTLWNQARSLLNGGS